MKYILFFLSFLIIKTNCFAINTFYDSIFNLVKKNALFNYEKTYNFKTHYNELAFFPYKNNLIANYLEYNFYIEGQKIIYPKYKDQIDFLQFIKIPNYYLINSVYYDSLNLNSITETSFLELHFMHHEENLLFHTSELNNGFLMGFLQKDIDKKITSSNACGIPTFDSDTFFIDYYVGDTLINNKACFFLSKITKINFHYINEFNFCVENWENHTIITKNIYIINKEDFAILKYLKYNEFINNRNKSFYKIIENEFECKNGKYYPSKIEGILPRFNNDNCYKCGFDKDDSYTYFCKENFIENELPINKKSEKIQQKFSLIKNAKLINILDINIIKKINFKITEFKSKYNLFEN